MKSKTLIKAGVTTFGLLMLGVAFAATYSGNSYIRTDGTMITGYGYTSNTVLSTWISTQCNLIVPGWGSAATGGYYSATNTRGPVWGYAETAQLYHRGERMYATCTHRLTVNNVLQPVWTSKSATITIP